MKQTLICLSVLLTASFQSYSQPETKTNILFDGVYIVKSGSVLAANLDIFTYLKFYEDGSVYLQSVSSNDPVAVSKWFGRGKTFSQQGTYKLDGNKITIHLDNKMSEDRKLEGAVETDYKGSVRQDGHLCLLRDKETEEKCFAFTKTQ
jgi:hypothetical protein